MSLEEPQMLIAIPVFWKEQVSESRKVEAIADYK